MEQEIASIIKFILEAAGNPHAYYWKIPEGFTRPSIFFATPEVLSGGETLKTYNLDYMWYLTFFHEDTNQAHVMALAAFEAIKRKRNLIPLVDINGDYLTDGIKGIRLSEPSLKAVDEGAVQLTLRWRSRRPYDIPDVQKMMV